MTLRFSQSCSSPAGTNQSGLTLVEILVTVVIISVGLLGVAALHLTSLRNGYDSNSRSQATWLANDIADHMRANLTDAQTGAYVTGLGTPPTTTPTATTDLAQWKNQLSNLLHGDGSIALTPIGGGSSDQVVTVTIQWNERGTTGATSLQMQFGI